MSDDISSRLASLCLVAAGLFLAEEASDSEPAKKVWSIGLHPVAQGLAATGEYVVPVQCRYHADRTQSLVRHQNEALRER